MTGGGITRKKTCLKKESSDIQIESIGNSDEKKKTDMWMIMILMKMKKNTNTIDDDIYVKAIALSGSNTTLDWISCTWKSWPRNKIWDEGNVIQQ